MAQLVTARLRMAEDSDTARKRILKEVGDLKEIDVYFNQILCAQYIREGGEAKTKGGIIVPLSTEKEDIYQGTVALVLKLGPMAFQDDHRNSFLGQYVAPGDWVVFKNSDGFSTVVGSWLCKIIEDSHIKLRIPRPDTVL
jgi:co-chaperonin GroES (HSP10)